MTNVPVNTSPAIPAPGAGQRRKVDQLLSHLDFLAETSPHLLSKQMGEFESDGRRYSLPRYLWVGPKGGGDTIRLGVFATLNGDEPEGALALTRFISALEKQPELAQGYALYLYPVCNPTGFEDGTRLSRAGHALNREFWSESTAPEVRYLESEIWMQAFHGILNLRSDASTDGVYGFASGAVLSDSLLQPALDAASKFLPINGRREIEGLPARKGIIYARQDGVIRAVPGLDQPPFEISLATPRTSPLHLQVEALHAGLTTILTEFRYLLAIGQNI